MTQYDATTQVSLENLGQTVKLAFKPESAEFFTAAGRKVVDSIPLDKLTIGLGVDFRLVGESSVVFEKLLPGSICVLSGEDHAAPFVVGGGGPPPVFVHVAGNALRAHNIFDGATASKNPLRVARWEHADQVFAPGAVLYQVDDVDVCLTPEGRLTLVACVTGGYFELRAFLVGGGSVFVRIQWESSVIPPRRLVFRKSGTRMLDGGEMVSWTVPDLPSVPNFCIIAPDGGVTYSETFRSNPAFATAVVKPASTTTGPSIECDVRSQDTGTDITAMPLVLVAFPAAEGVSCNYAALRIPIEYRPLETGPDGAAAEIRVPAPSEVQIHDLRRLFATPVLSPVESFKVDGVEFGAGVEALGVIAVTENGSVCLRAADYRGRKLLVSVAFEDGWEQAFRVEFVPETPAPAKTVFDTYRWATAYIPASAMFPLTHAGINLVVSAQVAEMGVSVVKRRSRGEPVQHLMVKERAFGDKIDVEARSLDNVLLCSFTVVVEGHAHLLSDNEDVARLDIGPNAVNARGAIRYFWVEAEIQKKSEIIGCFQAGDPVYVPGIGEFYGEGGMFAVELEDLCASKVPKLRYAWADGWGKLKFQVAPATAEDHAVMTAGQTLRLDIFDNDFNPNDLPQCVSYQTKGGKSSTLRIDNDRALITGSADGIVVVRPKNSDYTGPAFDDDVQTLVTGEDGETTESPLTVLIVASVGIPSGVVYAQVKTRLEGGRQIFDGHTEGSVWEGAAVARPVLFANYVVGGRIYSAGSVASLRSGVLRINADGNYVYSPNINLPIEGPVTVAEVYCYPETGVPMVLSLQQGGLVRSGPYHVRAAPSGMTKHQLSLDTETRVSEYALLAEPRDTTGAGRTLSFDEGSFAADKNGAVTIVTTGDGPFPTILLTLIGPEGRTHITRLNVVVCNDVTAARYYYTFSGSLGIAPGQEVTSYRIAPDLAVDGPSVLVGAAAAYGTMASFVSDAAGAYSLWVSSAFGGPLSVAFCVSANGAISNQQKVIMAEAAPTAGTRGISPPGAGRPELTSLAHHASGTNLTRRNSIRSPLGGRGSSAGLPRTRSPSVLSPTNGVATLYPMYPSGTFLDDAIVQEAGANNFAFTMVGGRRAYTLVDASQMLRVGSSAFRAVPYAADSSVVVAAAPGLRAQISALAGAAMVHLEDAPAGIEFSCVGGDVRIVVTSAVKACQFKAWGIFRRSPQEPEYAHCLEVELVPARIAPEVLEYSPASGIAVQAPLRALSHSAEELAAPPLDEAGKPRVLRVSLELADGVCESDIVLIPAAGVDGQVLLVPGVSGSYAAAGTRYLKFLADGELFQVSPTVKSGLTAASVVASALGDPVMARAAKPIVRPQQPVAVPKPAAKPAQRSQSPLEKAPDDLPPQFLGLYHELIKKTKENEKQGTRAPPPPRPDLNRPDPMAGLFAELMEKRAVAERSPEKVNHPPLSAARGVVPAPANLAAPVQVAPESVRLTADAATKGVANAVPATANRAMAVPAGMTAPVRVAAESVRLTANAAAKSASKAVLTGAERVSAAAMAAPGRIAAQGQRIAAQGQRIALSSALDAKTAAKTAVVHAVKSVSGVTSAGKEAAASSVKKVSDGVTNAKAAVPQAIALLNARGPVRSVPSSAKAPAQASLAQAAAAEQENRGRNTAQRAVTRSLEATPVVNNLPLPPPVTLQLAYELRGLRFISGVAPPASRDVEICDSAVRVRQCEAGIPVPAHVFLPDGATGSLTCRGPRPCLPVPGGIVFVEEGEYRVSLDAPVDGCRLEVLCKVRPAVEFKIYSDIQAVQGNGPAITVPAAESAEVLVSGGAVLPCQLEVGDGEVQLVHGMSEYGFAVSYVSNGVGRTVVVV